MTTERRQRIYHLLDRALKLEPNRRPAYLAQACGDDEALRREVESLLEAEEQAAADDFLETPAPVKFAELLASDPAHADGQPMILSHRYEIERRLSEGGVGIAYLAHDHHLYSKRVVVKVLNQNIPSYSYWERKFEDEVKALSRLRDRHIVGIQDRGQLPDGKLFCVLEYVEGSDLRSALKPQGMELVRVARIVRQVGEALSLAHDHLVIHRDLKPGNIMLSATGGEDFIVIIDFGLATVKEWQNEARRTRGGTTAVAGTPEYMAPEQIQGCPSAASDIYALGVIAYEMLTGRQPFPVPRDRQSNLPLLGELYKMQQAGVQVKPRELRPDLPEAAQAAILKALSFDPQARHPQARDFGEELATALTGERQTPPSSAPTEIVAAGIDQQPATPATIIRDQPGSAEVVISYAAQDLSRALRIAERLRAAGVACWLADPGHEVNLNDRSQTIRAVKHCKVVLLLCSDAALRSPLIKQDLQLAWGYERPYLPLLVEPIGFAEQTEYWLEGKTWIEAMGTTPEGWLPQVLQSLAGVGVHFHDTEQPTLPAGRVIQPTQLDRSLQSLRAIARFTDQIWPLPAERAERRAARSGMRGLGAPQPDVQHGYRLGSRVRLALEAERAGHLLLLDEGPEGILYCLCPSHFAPEPRLREGYNELPQTRSHYDSFVVTGQPGREHLLAIVSDAPLELDWLPRDSRAPARALNQSDINLLLARLRDLSAESWVALSTYFEVVG
jgi:serine/threonine protein kinase